MCCKDWRKPLKISIRAACLHAEIKVRCHRVLQAFFCFNKHSWLCATSGYIYGNHFVFQRQTFRNYCSPLHPQQLFLVLMPSGSTRGGNVSEGFLEGPQRHLDHYCYIGRKHVDPSRNMSVSLHLPLSIGRHFIGDQFISLKSSLCPNLIRQNKTKNSVIN